ncbi:LOW QUALITY PROTEIN: uncharacterized protein ACR2FA_002529 [Aphomia sociella]
MSGKSYTMKEMKGIVEYLVAHRAYSEVRGRKMWLDFASSSQTSRTWQSLKETFLKRILPDIQNPYYKLTMEQIRSFKQGLDIEKREKNKLEVCEIDGVSTTNDKNQNNEDQPSTSNENEGEKVTGEDSISSKIPVHNRASTETIVLDPEEVQKELESPKRDKISESLDDNKTLRDFITYAEPLTPMLQEVLHDFSTDESSNEPVLKIDERNESDREKPLANNHSHKATDGKFKADSSSKKCNVEKKLENDTSSVIVVQDSDLFLDSQITSSDQNKGIGNTVVSEDVTKKTEVHIVSSKETNNTQNSSVSTNDTALPGNQEAFAHIGLQKSKELANNKDSNKSDAVKKLKLSRRRANSHDNFTNSEKKRKLKSSHKQKSISDAGSGVEEVQNNFKRPTPLPKKDTKIHSNDTISKCDKYNANASEMKSLHNKSCEITSSQSNPCLKSVSLFAEQFNTTKYSDSESGEDVTVNTNNNIKNARKGDINANNPKDPKIAAKVDSVQNIHHTSIDINKVVILKSQSESDTESKDEPTKKPKQLNRVDKLQRDKALASIFGFSSGEVTKNRKRNLSCQRPSTSHRYSQSKLNQITIESSEWTSESDSDYISPPRVRKYKQTRKYLKPKSARILSLEEEGGLFVMHGKRIYPLVKNGNIIKNYLTYDSNSDKEEDPFYWKKKYEEEKKTEELKMLLDEANDSEKIRGVSPILPTSAIQKLSNVHNNYSSPRKINENKEQIPVQVEKKDDNKEEKTVKIKFTKNNEELQLEGHWSHIHPVLAEVVQIFNKDEKDGVKQVPSNGNATETCNGDLNPPAPIIPLIDEVPSTSSTSPRSTRSVKKSKLDEKVEAENVNLIATIKDDSATDFKQENKTTNKNELPTPTTDTPTKPNTEKRASTRNSKSKLVDTNNVEAEDDNIRYMFPSKKQITRKSAVNAKKIRPSRSLTNARKLTASPNLSIDSTQGYQDSDICPSPFRIVLRKKRKMSLSNVLHKGKIRLRCVRRKSYPYFADDASSESSNSRIIVQKSSTSLNPEVYKSESYQLLMPQGKSSFNVLEKIEENRNTSMASLKNDFEKSLDNETDTKVTKIESNDSTSCNVDGVNSSSVSLPLSPELSVVEQLSVSRELLKSFQDHPSINQMQANSEASASYANYSKYMISEVDVSMPLMGQKCQIQKTTPSNLSPHTSNIHTMSDYLLDKIDNENVKAQSISDSLDLKLRNMLLESAKKMQVSQCETNLITLNENNIPIENIDLNKKTKAKKRCSTPRKRKGIQKSQLPNIEPVVEERMEFCSYGGRKSCPPTLQIVSNESANMENTNNNILSKDITVNKTRGKIKKDIIKVKILRPKNKSTKIDENLGHKSKDFSRASVQTDSGINDTSYLLLQTLNDDSIDLIHNHSDTCLQANECLESVELIENEKSIISLNTNSVHSFDKYVFIAGDSSSFSGELYCENAQDGANLPCGTSINSGSNNDTIYHSPIGSELSANSLITEDLSEEMPSLPFKTPLQQVAKSKWYLLSEDETTNTNLQAPSFGANLNQIFPITCAVPDLSTITEMSKENDENSRMPSFDVNGDTESNFDSQSLFNLYLS